MEDKNGRENITQSNLCSFKHKGISGSYSKSIGSLLFGLKAINSII